MRTCFKLLVFVIGGTVTLPGVPALADAPVKGETTFAPKALGMEVPVVTSAADLDKHVGRLVAVRGKVSNTKVQRIAGVFVSASDDLRTREAEAYAVGILVKWSITEKDHRKRMEESRKQGNLVGPATLGPGTYYTLYVDLQGKRAEALPIPVGGK